jgi:hypothetical protein
MQIIYLFYSRFSVWIMISIMRVNEESEYMCGGLLRFCGELFSIFKSISSIIIILISYIFKYRIIYS